MFAEKAFDYYNKKILAMSFIIEPIVNSLRKDDNSE